MATKEDDNAMKHRQRFGDVAAEPGRMLPPIQGYEKMPIVSLEESVERLVNLVEDIKEYVFEAKKKCPKPPAHGLTVDESASILIYTMQWKHKKKSLYDVFNATLRSEDRNSLKPWFLYMRLIMNSLSKIPSTLHNLYRGVKLDLSKQYMQKKIVWWAFSSCTTTADVLENEMFFGKNGERTLFVIECHSAKDIRPHSAFPSENELLLVPGTEFQITSCFDPGNGLHMVQLKETNSIIFNPGRAIVAGYLPSPSVNPGQSERPPVTQPPKSQSIPMVRDPNYRNQNLERRINSCQARSEIDLNGQVINMKDISIVVEEAIDNKRCTKLSLRDNNITSEGVSMLAQAVQNSTTVEQLDLGNNRLSDAGVRILADALSDNETYSEKQSGCCGIPKMKVVDKAPIKILDLSNNGIRDEGARYLKEVITTKRTITDLWLNDNEIGDQGVEALAKALKHPQANLKKLYLHNNKFITDASVGALVNMLKSNQSLQALSLTNCNLTDYGRRKLREAVTSKKKFFLDIENSDSL